MYIAGQLQNSYKQKIYIYSMHTEIFSCVIIDIEYGILPVWYISSIASIFELKDFVIKKHYVHIVLQYKLKLAQKSAVFFFFLNILNKKC